MMDHLVMFDTHAFVKNMIAAGMSEAVAEALVTEQQKWNNTNLTNLATKQDLEMLQKVTRQDLESLRQDFGSFRQEIRQEIEHRFARVDDRIESFRQEIKHDIAQAQKSLIMWIVSMFIMFNGLMFAMIKFL